MKIYKNRYSHLFYIDDDCAPFEAYCVHNGVISILHLLGVPPQPGRYIYICCTALIAKHPVICESNALEMLVLTGITPQQIMEYHNENI